MMSNCMAQDDYPCSNRNKCRAKNYRNINVYEPPEREISKNNNGKTPSCQLPPPQPPSGDWDLQYCQWQGWTWVKKQDKDAQSSKHVNIQPSAEKKEHGAEQQLRVEAKPQQEAPKPTQSQSQEPPKKNGGLFSCFKKKQPPKPPPKEPAKSSMTSLPPPQLQPKKSDQEVGKSAQGKSARPKSSEDRLGDYCYCCPCTQICCPCMLQSCCCCHGDDDRRRESKSIETQTCGCDVKEQATKMSDVDLPKQVQCGAPKRICRCRRSVCCPCMRPTCCPCVQNTCCPCTDKPQKKETKSCREINSQVINYCLTNNRKPTAVDFLNLKTDFSTLHKSLDLLLKNNINIMGLFNDRKELSMKPSLSSNHTISFLSNDNVTKRTDQEHSKLLTAVCDAILSSHKFDNDKLSSSVKPVRDVSSKTSQKYSEEIFSSRGFLEKILSDLNFPTLTKSDDDINKEIGVQVNQKERRAKKSLTKLTRNKSRILAAPRFPRKVEALRKTIDLIRLGYSDKGSRRVRKHNTENKHLTFDCSNTPQASTSKKDETIDNLLKAIDFVSISASKTGMEDETEQANHLLDTTSSPYTDLDLLLSLDDDKQKVGES